MQHSMRRSLGEAFRAVHFRGKARLLNAVCPRSGVKRAQIFGNWMELDLSDFIQRQIYLGTSEPRETLLVKRYLHPGMTFVDVGANVGYYTALAATQVAGGAGRVVAFEPSLYAFEKLKRWVEGNRLEHVTAVNAGLSDSSGKTKIYLGIGSDNHTPTMVAHENANATEVSIVTLDAEAERLGLDRIDLIKIDVEGHEPKMLAGAKRLLKERRIRAVLCEFNEHWLRKAGSSPQELERIFREAGFLEDNLKNVPAGYDNRFFRLAG
jgi:FkbM family methyltransferase